MAAKSAPARGVDTKTAGAPNQTLYCTNLPDKLHKQDLRTSLYTLFSTYGTVLDVVAMKTKQMRGQAHVVFKDVQASTQAMRDLQGFEFFGRQMKIVYGKGTSNIIGKLRGTYNPPATEPEIGGVSTDLQKSIFNGPPGSIPVRPAEANGDSHGTKRPRDDESDEGEAPMEEDSDVPMEASSDED